MSRYGSIVLEPKPKPLHLSAGEAVPSGGKTLPPQMEEAFCLDQKRYRELHEGLDRSISLGAMAFIRSGRTDIEAIEEERRNLDTFDERLERQAIESVERDRWVFSRGRR